MPTARLPLTYNIESRTHNTEKDSRLVNAVVEGEDIVKRPGLIDQEIVMNTDGSPLPAGQGQGIYSWNSQLISGVGGHVYSIVGNKATELSGSPPSGFDPTYPLSFSQVASDGYVVFHDGSNIYYYQEGSGKTLTNALGGTTVSSINITAAGGWYGTPTVVTISSASPGVVTHTGHGFTAADNGRGVSFYTITGTIPVAITQYETYALVYINANTYSLTTTGTTPTAINTASASTGTVYVMVSPLVTFSGGSPATPAAGTAVLFNHQVKRIILSNVGIGYSSAPVITMSAAETGTTATAAPGFYYVGTTIPTTTIGSKYLVEPNISFYNSYTGLLRPDILGYTTIDTSGGVTSFVRTSGLYYVGYVQGILQAIIDPPLNTTATAVAVMSGTITGPFAAGMAYLDGSLFVMKKADGNATGTAGTIYGSGLDDPTSWNVLNAIIANSDTDVMVGIARHLNYIVAFGIMGTEFLYNATLAAPYSPLEVNKSAYLEIGCANGYSIADVEQSLIWVGTSLTEGRSVYMLSGLSPIKVSTRYIDKYLNLCDMTNNTFNYVRAYCLKISGHSLYVLTMTDINYTFVYDLDEKKWYQWTSQSGETNGTDGTETYFTSTSYTGHNEYYPDLYLQDDSNGKIYILSPIKYSDIEEPIYLRAVSPIADSGTTKRKFYTRVEVVGDKTDGTGKIRHSSDDYSTWSTYRSVNLLDTRPILYQNGTARRRAWEFFCSDNVPIRLKALELDFDIGEQGGGNEG